MPPKKTLSKMNPFGLKKDEYDVIIIGAGIGGLVCGCYLAKAGMKVLIVEKNDKPGGCCTSFTRNGYNFDAGVHAFGGLHETGKFREIFQDLNLTSILDVTRIEPSDIIILPNGKISFGTDLNRTISDFQGIFPKESANIVRFFNYISNTSFVRLYISLKDKTFQQLLDEFFTDQHLKSTLGIVLGNVGVSYKKISALVAVILYKEFIIGGGYYPKKGGVQALPNALLQRFKEYRGNILLSRQVTKIVLNNNVAIGVIINKRDRISSRFVVSGGDATQTYLSLLNDDLRNKISNTILNLLPSPSAFIVHIGLKPGFKDYFKMRCSGLWHFPSWKLDSDKIYLHSLKSDNILFRRINPKDKRYCVFCSLSDLSVTDDNKLHSLHLLVNAPFLNRAYWEENENSISDDLIERLEYTIPHLKRFISTKETTTPWDLSQFTGNFNGAAYGWASILSQTKSKLVPASSNIKNLFHCGHWVTSEFGASGISTVAYSGKRVNDAIQKLIKNVH